MADIYTRIGEWRLATDAGGWPRAVLGGTWDRPYLTVAADAETLHVAAIEVPIAVVRAVIERSAPVTALGEIEQLVDRYVGAIDEAMQASELAAEEYVPNEPRQKREREAQAAADATGTARTALLGAIRRALADRDERIAALEAGLREAADLIAAVRDGYSDDPCGGPPRYLLDAIVADEPRLRALADAPKK